MAAKNLIEMALAEQKCTQNELAAKLGVSKSQVSRWKNDPAEHMSHAMTEKLRAFAGLLTNDPDADVVAWAGSADAARQWRTLFLRLAEDADENAETGYRVGGLDEDNALTSTTVQILTELGIAAPTTSALTKPDYDDVAFDEQIESFHDALVADPIAMTVQKIYAAYANVWGFRCAYLSDILNDDESDDDLYLDFEGCLLHLAATKIDVDKALAPHFDDFQRKWLKQYREWIDAIILHAFKTGRPLSVELRDIVYLDDESLGREAERKALGFDQGQLHPDVYMNELFAGDAHHPPGAPCDHGETWN
jgi:transcriptional regulator with XRE-family HTH domain